jgi:hypothetical protein
LTAYAVGIYGQESPTSSATFTFPPPIQVQPGLSGKDQPGQAGSSAKPVSDGYPGAKSAQPRAASIAPSLIAVGTNQTTISSADFNQDSKADLIIGGSTGDQAQLYYGNGDGTFNPAAAPNATLGQALLFDVDDFNGDGYPDVAVTLNGAEGLAILLNDGKGNLQAATQPYNAGGPINIASSDFNADGLSDLALLQPTSNTSPAGFIDTLLSEESAQASLVTPAQSLPAGMDSITASYSGDSNFLPSTSAAVAESVAKGLPNISWPNPASIVYGTPLSATQLDASASTPGTFAYSPAPNTILPPGNQTIKVTFAPTDSFDYSGATAQATLQISLPTVSLTSLSPASAPLGNPQPVTISLGGVGFESDAVVRWNGASLATTYVGPDSLMAVIPVSDFTAAGPASIAVYNPTSGKTSNSGTFTVSTVSPVTSVTVPPTAEPGDQPSVALVLNPYPVAVTVTMTLGFTDNSASPASTNGSVMFMSVPATDVLGTSPSGQPTDTFTIPANTATSIPPRIISAGSVQGVITVTTTLSAGDTNITPPSLAVSQVIVAASVPSIQSATFSSSGDTLQVVVIGSSSTRAISSASFHFTPVMGKTLTTNDVQTTPTEFPAWFSNSESGSYGSAFTYTQSFTLNVDAGVVDSVSVTLENGQGSSVVTNAQPQ